VADINDLRRAASASRQARDAARTELRDSALQLNRVDRALLEARRQGAHEANDANGEHGEQPNRRVSKLEREQAALREQIDAGKRRLDSSRERARAVLDPFFVDPQNLVSQLDATTPFLLFPVRIETKFANAADGVELRVRIFPDDIAIAHHEKTLTAGEQSAGEDYWRSRAQGSVAPTAGQGDTIIRGAWNLIASRCGSYRSSWIVRATQPSNWSGEGAAPVVLNFPVLETKPLNWSEVPRSQVMPDLFAIVLERGEDSRTVLGRPVPDDLALGPDPLQADGFLTRDATSKRLDISDDLRWLIDFNRAEAVGMGVRIALSRNERIEGFDRILVLGLRLSSDGFDSAALLAELVESHRYSQGMSIVAQGTPTNNTEEAKSGLTTGGESVAETYALEHDADPYPVSANPLRQLDGQRLANALGVPLDAVRALPNARRADIAESVAMNRALWSATLGNFVKELLDGSFTPGDIGRMQSFLTEFVHGRGLVPAIRVGAQPYGVVVTGSFDDWIWDESESGRDGDFWARLQAQLALLRSHWQSVANRDVRFVGKRDSKGVLLDPFETLIDVIGLQASSVEFWSRTGVPDAYLAALAAYAENDADLVKNWIANAKNNRTLELVNAHLPASSKAAIGRVLFLEKPEPVRSPVIDGDPSLPLSESQPIRPYDTVAGHNYIAWLATASNADIQNQRFLGADGKAVASPDALLYKLLRVATLAEVQARTRLLAERVRADVFADAPSIGETPNIAAPVLMPAHFAMVDTEKIGLTQQSMSTGDYLLGHARAATPVAQKPPEAAPLATLMDALVALASLPTARLERLLAEHVDITSSRLDAWLGGMFARRLAIQRQRQQRPGTFIGAYGWLVDVRPAKDRQAVPAAEIPGELKDAVDGPVVSFAHNGGFVHAPSLSHAVTAAVLRNAYLTHAEPQVADRMAVNLSSARVRMALDYIDGLQNGQELGALLGYQLERGMHEGHPGIELDAFVYVLRQRFPLISNKLTATPGDAPAEVVEARNVVNGYDFLDFIKDKSYPYGIDGLPAAAGSPAQVAQAGALQAEVSRLRDALDAVADLLLAESVHQVVQGNHARARGAIQALTDGEFPPLPDVVQTPRSGKSLTHRVALFLEPGAGGGWTALPTPRATGNAPLNDWLASVLPDPAEIQWQVSLGTDPPRFPSVATLGLEPVDLVLMSGERIGDLTSSLEQLLVRDFRETHGVADDVLTFMFKKPDPSFPAATALIFDPNTAKPGAHSLGSLLPLLKALRRLVTAARPLGARDLMRPTEAAQAHPENPNGFDGTAAPLKDLGELKARVEAAHASLTVHAQALRALIVTMQPLADALAQAAVAAPTVTPPIQPAWTALLPQLRDRLRAIALYGLPEAMPSAALTMSVGSVSAEFTQATGVEAVVGQKLAKSRALLDTAFVTPLPPDPIEAARAIGVRVSTRVDAYSQAARMLLGDEYVAIPLFAAHPEGLPELAAATAAPAETDALVVEGWIQSLAQVRPAMRAWDMLASYQDWLRGPAVDFVPIQLPVEPGARWLGSSYANTVTADDAVSIAVHRAPASYASPMAGLLIDEWTELVPAATETTGLAMHINRPNAVAPQALLLAVAPRATGRWAWEDLVAILHDTMDRARLRAVEPDSIGYPYAQLLPTIVTPFDESMLMAAAKFANVAAATKA